MPAADIPSQMRAILFSGTGQGLSLVELPVPSPAEHELLIKVSACGVCRTDLHVIDGELTDPLLPVVPGHQIVGTVVAAGAASQAGRVGERVGVPWLGGSCGTCGFCNAGQENLCDDAIYTGYQRHGGFAEYTVADSRYCFSLPDGYTDVQAAPLLCAGLIGYRAWRMALETPGKVNVIGFYGFGAAAHILVQVARHAGKTVYAYSRPGDTAAQEFATQLGASWAGASDEQAPGLLDSAIIFAPEGGLVPIALQAVRKGGRVVCAGIHMSDIPSFAYDDLWGERAVMSVANLTRRDGEEFLPLAAAIPVETEVHAYPLDKAADALEDLRAGRFSGAAVIVP
jgi:propanol-preferring alcohol dehydrogenase